MAGIDIEGLATVYPNGVRAVDGLITGWHAPDASHLDMLRAIGGPVLIARSYRAAEERGYLWHEFGDVELILRGATPPIDPLTAVRPHPHASWSRP